MRENPFADSLPPCDGLFTTKSGTLWVVDAIAPSDTVWTATAFQSDGFSRSAALRPPVTALHSVLVLWGIHAPSIERTESI